MHTLRRENDHTTNKKKTVRFCCRYFHFDWEKRVEVLLGYNVCVARCFCCCFLTQIWRMWSISVNPSDENCSIYDVELFVFDTMVQLCAWAYLLNLCTTSMCSTHLIESLKIIFKSKTIDVQPLVRFCWAHWMDRSLNTKNFFYFTFNFVISLPFL